MLSDRGWTAAPGPEYRRWSPPRARWLTPAPSDGARPFRAAELPAQIDRFRVRADRRRFQTSGLVAKVSVVRRQFRADAFDATGELERGGLSSLSCVESRRRQSRNLASENEIPRHEHVALRAHAERPRADRSSSQARAISARQLARGSSVAGSELRDRADREPELRRRRQTRAPGRPDRAFLIWRERDPREIERSERRSGACARYRRWLLPSRSETTWASRGESGAPSFGFGFGRAGWRTA